MRDEEKSKAELLEELRTTRKEVDVLKSSRVDLEKTDEEVRRAKDYLSNVIDSSLDCIIVSDSRGYITRTNMSFLTLLGIKEKDAIGKIIAEFSVIEAGTYQSTTGESVDFDDSFFEEARRVIAKLHEVARITNWETYFVRNDKKVVPVELNIALIYDDRQELAGSVGVIRDITQRKMSEELLRNAHESEKIVAIAEIAGAAAHELNQPLTSVMTSVAMLRRILEGNDMEKRILDTIEQESDRMASMIRRLAKITNYKTKKYVGNAKIVDLDGSSSD